MRTYNVRLHAASAAAFMRRSWVAQTVLVVIAFVLPFLLLLAFVVRTLSASSEAAQKSLLLYTAQSIASAVDTELQRYLTIGTMLAASEHLARNDLPAFRVQAAAMLDGMELWVVLHDGPQQIYNSAFPDLTSLPHRSGEGFRAQQQAAVENKQIVSDVYIGALQNRWVATVEIPTSKVAGGRYALAIVFPLAPFRKLLNTLSVQSGWVVGIADSNGRFVAGFPQAMRNTGDPISPDWRRRLGAAGIDEFRTVEGTLVVNANALPTLSRWTVGVGISRESLNAAATRTTRWIVYIELGIFLVLALVGFLLTKQMSTSLMAVQNALVARLQGARDVVPFIPRELDSLWNAAGKAADDVRSAEDQARRSSEILRAISDFSPDLIFAKDRERRLMFVSQSIGQLFQTPVAALLGQDERSFLQNPDEIRTIQDHDLRVLAGEVITREEPVTDSQGRRRIYLSNKLPWRNEQNEIIGILGISVDITERRQNEERMAVVMREVSHRAKNMLTVVQAIARSSGQTAEDKETFLDGFNQRLMALSQALDVLVSNDWRGADLEGLLRAQLDHLQGDLGKRITLKGPSFSVNAAATQTLGMAVHELSTNAVKYGALSNGTGNVELTWVVRDETFEMMWIERGGPNVRPPTRVGFGSTVIDTMVRWNFECDPAISFAPDGFSWSIKCRRDVLEVGTSPK